MVIIHAKPKRKATGGTYTKANKKRKFQKGNSPSMTKVSETKVKSRRIIGGGSKSFLLNVNFVNAYNSKTKKHIKVKVLGVVDSPANRHFVRRNIITKGAVIDTDKGKVRVTSRPGQSSSLEAIFI